MQGFFKKIYQQLSPALRQFIEHLLIVPEGKKRALFYQLKEYPPASSISSIQSYFKRYQILEDAGIETFVAHMLEPGFAGSLFNLTKRYSAKDIKKFGEQKRYALMICFLLEIRKVLLDHLVTMHDQYVTEMCRESRNAYEKKHKTDKHDARAFAFFLSKDMLPESRLRKVERSQLSSLIQMRDQLVKLRVSLLNKVHGLFNRHGIRIKKETLTSRKGFKTSIEGHR